MSLRSLSGRVFGLVIVTRSRGWGGEYSGFQVTGMSEGFFGVWNLRFWDFWGVGKFVKYFLGWLDLSGVLFETLGIVCGFWFFPHSIIPSLMKSGVPFPPGPEGHRLVACNKFFRDALEAVRKKYPSWEYSDNFFRGTYVIDWKSIFPVVTRLKIHYHISVPFQMIKT